MAILLASTGEIEELSTKAPLIELTSSLDPHNSSDINNIFRGDPAMFDILLCRRSLCIFSLFLYMLSLADNKLEKLNEQVQTLLEEKEALEEKVCFLATNYLK